MFCWSIILSERTSFKMLANFHYPRFFVSVIILLIDSRFGHVGSTFGTWLGFHWFPWSTICVILHLLAVAWGLLANWDWRRLVARVNIPFCVVNLSIQLNLNVLYHMFFYLHEIHRRKIECFVRTFPLLSLFHFW